MIKVGDIVLLKSGEIVRITEVRDKNRYAYPLWYENIRTSMPNGCKYEDVEGYIESIG